MKYDYSSIFQPCIQAMFRQLSTSGLTCQQGVRLLGLWLACGVLESWFNQIVHKKHANRYSVKKHDSWGSGFDFSLPKAKDALDQLSRES